MRSIEVLTHQRTPRELRQLQQDWWQEIQPLVRMKARCIGLAPFRILLQPDGTVEEVERIYTPEQQREIATIDAALQLIREHYERLAGPRVEDGGNG